MNRLEALRYFCAAAETLQFRQAASRLSVSPQVVTRAIAELEAALGEPLFVRSTRQVRLTDFGTRFLPRAQQFLLDGEKLFATARQKDDEMAGVVRITVPRLPGNEALLADLLARCADYPDLVIDWRVDEACLNAVENCIDMGVRLGLEPQPLMIVRRIAQTRDLFVAAPQLLARLGPPRDLEDLRRRFPASSLIHAETGRSWGWPVNDGLHLTPALPRFVSNDPCSELAAALAGRVCALLPDDLCRAPLQEGRLVELFPSLRRASWSLFLYRPQRSMTPARVLAVFDWLTQALRRQYAARQ